jgi:hypothetical protein
LGPRCRCGQQDYGVARANPTQLTAGQRLDRGGIGADRLEGLVEFDDALLELDGSLLEPCTLLLHIG